MDGVTALIPVIVIALVLVTQFFIASRYDWQCGNCGHVFSISPAAAALMPHRPVGRKLARCPNCGVRSWVSPVPKQ
jgi:ribosomal protein S27AE